MRNAVLRTDDNGHSFIIAQNLTEDEAETLFLRVEKGHKQFYTILCYTTQEELQELLINFNVKS